MSAQLDKVPAALAVFGQELTGWLEELNRLPALLTEAQELVKAAFLPIKLKDAYRNLLVQRTVTFV